MPSLIKWARFRFLAAVIVPAAVLMALEIVSSRLLAPEFGNSVYVWGSIIGVFLAAMSAGYVLGGGLADRRPELPVLGTLLLLSALAQWATAIFGRSAVDALGEATGGRPAGTLLATALLFAPATVLLATVSPFAVRFAGRERERLGNVAGGLFALSTAGSLGGTLLATFALIPALPVDRILGLLVAATALSAALLFERPLQRLAAVALGAFALVPLAPRGVADEILVERATPYQTIVVRELAGRRTLTSDGTKHGEIDVATGEPTLRYHRVAESLRLFSPEPRRALLLGMGSGLIGRLLVERTPGLSVRYVEIDPAMVETAERYFGFAPERSGGRLDAAITDGRRYLVDHEESWDWIYCDTYIGQAVPFHLATREFFALVRSRLAPGGAFGLNLAGSVEHPFSRAILRTLKQVFARVEIFGVPSSGNFLLIAHDGEPVPPSELAARAAALDDAAGGPGPWPRFAAFARARQASDLELESVPVLVDGFAPVDSLLNLGSREARFPGVAAEAP